MDKTDDQIARERTSVDAMRNAKANMATVLDRVATLEQALKSASGTIASLKNYIAPGAYRPMTNDQTVTQAAHDCVAEAIAQEIADHSPHGKKTDNYARIYQAAYLGAAKARKDLAAAHSGEGRSNGAGERGETAWLIERDNSGPEYACGRGWTRDHRDALRFLSETDAANFASGAYKMVWTGEVAEYFDWHDFTRIAEHRWG